MKKIGWLLVLVVLLFVSCGNYRVSLGLGDDLQYTYAAVYNPGNGEVLEYGRLDKWTDHEDATVDLWFANGHKYLVHSINTVMSNYAFE